MAEENQNQSTSGSNFFTFINTHTKYILIPLSILLFLYGAKLMGINFDTFQFGDARVKIINETNEDKSKTIVVMAEMQNEIHALKEQLSVLQHSSVSQGAKHKPSSKNKANQTAVPTVASDTTEQAPKALAALALSAASSSGVAKLTSLLHEKQGYIWIGNKRKGTWDGLKLSRNNKLLSPEELLIGEDYLVQGNMYLRADLPPNNALYYKSVQALGVIPEGTRVRLLEKPIGIDRGFAIQYWTKVVVKE